MIGSSRVRARILGTSMLPLGAHCSHETQGGCQLYVSYIYTDFLSLLTTHQGVARIASTKPSWFRPMDIDIVTAFCNIYIARYAALAAVTLGVYD